MGKNLQAKCKQCRRAGEKLFLKGDRCSTTKCAMVKRNYPPGFHGPNKMKKRMTNYGTQLNEKQKAKKQYCILEKQFRITFEKAKAKTGNTGDIFVQLLEMRFDNIIYRAGLASSRGQARQLVNHGHFTVNDGKMTIPSYTVRIGDEIKIKSTKANNKFFKNISEKLKNNQTPGWLHLDPKKAIVKILQAPDMKTTNPNFNVQMIIEFYSR
jgi:small subunit ribosomal protein S4